jgi:protein arginine N-methyltransferase 1
MENTNKAADAKSAPQRCHDKRRAKNKQKKETEATPQQPAQAAAKQEKKPDSKQKQQKKTPEDKAREDIISKLAFTEEETKNSVPFPKDEDMRDESVPSQSESTNT